MLKKGKKEESEISTPCPIESKEGGGKESGKCVHKRARES